MIGGASKILSDNEASVYPASEFPDFSTDEIIEAKEIVAALNKYADEVITYELDATDLKDSATSAFGNMDLELLRVYKNSLGADIFWINFHVRLMRGLGYKNLDSIFNEDSANLFHGIDDALLDASSISNSVFSSTRMSELRAYVIANPSKAVVVEEIIRTRNLSSIEAILEIVYADVSTALTDGVL